ncbi:putative malate:quinone oxidoreductase [Zafaria cholistanensis]|uniref:Probable malate:quinone oxidoreductase n=1 Tax=Zafaria cholistanensis TaxID=1682741 RepID=A0A5A7NMN0_9MICC|nr:malate:quinone oxidoreductase [Zafaria cholistanensis]GER22213.1 putative malate:quinone oxidoreductase [Zafaria cholistanensis]
MEQATTPTRGTPAREDADVVLVGGGIMSATLGAMLALLEPDWRIVLLERGGQVAAESTSPWNNAGTGHAGYCELNYMPDPEDPTKAAEVSRQFLLSRQWWSHLAEAGHIDPAEFIRATAHLSIVFGTRDVGYLRRRCEVLRHNPLFAGIEFSDHPATVARWAPLAMAGRSGTEAVAASRHADGTDVDFGALSRALLRVMAGTGGMVRLRHEVRGLRRDGDGRWNVSGTDAAAARRFSLRARFVFVGAGGSSLGLLQKARVPEVRGYGVLPVGAAFLRCSRPEVVQLHDAKMYGQARDGAPALSVPHLDRRSVGGQEHLMFGPYATFSTRLLKHGRRRDLFGTLRWNNVHVLAAALAQNPGLVRFLIRQLLAGDQDKLAQLRRLYPGASWKDWEVIHAGQRAQLVVPDRRRVGALQLWGTKLTVTEDGSMAGLLGASPGASTAVPIMVDLLQRAFPTQWEQGWRERMHAAVPGLARDHWDAGAVAEVLGRTSAALKLRP